MANSNYEASAAASIPTRTVEEINKEFHQVGCLGHGGMGTSVFLARKKSGRHVALKVMLHDDDDHCQECFTREVTAVSRLNKNDKSHEDERDLAIIYFEEWFTGPGFSCIVMSHVNGGTLAQEIHRRATTTNAEPFTERRIGWYALQLCEALAYAHERGVSHHDVKSSNCLIDLSRGGRLVLADFGSAVAPGEGPVGFSEIYASPELLVAHAREDYTCLDSYKVDAFGLGCILFELLCCQKLVDLTTGDQTLAEFIRENGVDAALDLPNLRLPWLPAVQATVPQVIGYSNALRGLVGTLLEPDPNQRWLPSRLQDPLRSDPRSPLLTNTVVAAQVPVPGVPVTIDNVQLGMFVQRGPDWEEGENMLYGPLGTVGVIIKLDPDGLYTEVAWPVEFRHQYGQFLCCRIGAGNKYELQVGPTPMIDFCKGGSEPITSGLVRYENGVSDFKTGQLVNNNCVVLGVNDEQRFILVAPLERIVIPPIAGAPVHYPSIQLSIPHKPRSELPKHWQPSEGFFVDVTDIEEKSGVIERFHSTEGGMDIQDYEITSIKRIQCPELWELYTVNREGIAAENWGLANEQQLFHGTGTACPETMLRDWSDFYQNCSYGGNDIGSREIRFSGAKWANETGHRQGTGERKIVLSRVALGRVLERPKNDPTPFAFENSSCFHSEKKACDAMSPRASRRNNYMIFAIRCALQAVPEYILTYKPLRDSPDSRPVASTSRRIPIFINGVAAGYVRSRHRAGQRAMTSESAPRTSPGVHSADRPFGRSSFSSSPMIGLDLPASSATRGHGTAAQRNGALASGAAKASVAKQQSRKPKEAPKEEPKIKPSPSKMCVVCLGKPVCRILLPCGHPCLCEICSTEQGLAKLRRKCPECRSKIREAVTIYGRVVDD